MDLANIQGVTQQTIDAIKAVLTGGGNPYIPNGVRKDVSTSLGLVAYNLEPVARLLQPAFSPLRNRIPRVQNTAGGTAASRRASSSRDRGPGISVSSVRSCGMSIQASSPGCGIVEAAIIIT